MNYPDFVVELLNGKKTQEEVLNELTEREIETDDKEFFSFCEHLREKLANRGHSKEWKEALLDELENDCINEERGHGNHGEA